MKKKLFSIRNSVWLIVAKIGKTLGSKSFGRIPLLSKFYYWVRNRMDPKGIILIETKIGKLYVDSTDKGIAYNLITEGIYEKYGSKLINDNILSNTIFIDIGANIGYYTILASNIIKTGRIYSFEPEPKNYNLLSKNVNLNNLDNVTIMNKAVSNTNGSLKLFIDNNNSFSPSFSHENVEYSEFLNVQTVTMDYFFENMKNGSPIFIKMDVQGAEGKVISGADNLLKNSNLKIFMEFWPQGLLNLGTNPLDLLKTLEDYNFKIKIAEEDLCLYEFYSSNDIMRFLKKQNIKKINLLFFKE